MSEEEEGKEVQMTKGVQKMVEVALMELQCEKCPFGDIQEDKIECNRECKQFIRRMEMTWG